MENKKMKSTYKKEDALNTIDRNTTWINTADNKSSILLGILSVLFGGTLINLDTEFMQEIILNGTLDKKILALFISLFATILLISVLLTFIFLIAVILSRTSSKIDKPAKRVSYFNDITRYRYEEFTDEIIKIKEEELLQDLISQVYITSSIASKKYKLLSRGYISFAVYFGSTFVYALLINFL